MYLIFIHLSGLSLLEILFYFLYVGPMETKTFKETINNSIRPEDDIPLLYIQNINITTNLPDFQGNLTKHYELLVNEQEQARNKYNYNLFISALNTWAIIISFTFFVILIEGFRYYYKKKKSNLSITTSDVSVEMVSNQPLHYTIANSDTSSQVSEFSLTSINKNKRKILINIFHFVSLLSLILGFEFWFFDNIVMKYKIISKEELEYMILTQFLPLLNNY